MMDKSLEVKLHFQCAVPVHAEDNWFTLQVLIPVES